MSPDPRHNIGRLADALRSAALVESRTDWTGYAERVAAIYVVGSEPQHVHKFIGNGQFDATDCPNCSREDWVGSEPLTDNGRILPDDTVCACLHETGERKVKRYDQCQRCGAFMLADDDNGAELALRAVAEAAAVVAWTYGSSRLDALRDALAALAAATEAGSE